MGGLMAPVDTAREALKRGIQPVAVHGNSKQPIRKDWPTIVYTEQTINLDFKEGVNVGLRWGEGLVDIDLENATIAQIAGALLPHTEFSWGRPSNPKSHKVYQVEAGAKSRKYRSFDKELICELRGVRYQSVIPDSSHPSGEHYEWTNTPFGDATKLDLDELMIVINEVCMAYAFATSWAACGSRHEAALGIAGFLAKCGVLEERAVEIIAAITASANDEEAADRVSVVKGTYQKFNADGEVAGLQKIIEVFDEVFAKWLVKLMNSGEKPKLQAANDIPLNDLGNARWMASVHGDSLRYTTKWKKWLTWDGTRWNPNQDLQERVCAHATLSHMRGAAPAIFAHQAERTAFLNHVQHSENTAQIDAMISEARVLLRVVEDQFDADPWLFNTVNCTIDLRTMQTHDHTRDDLLTKRSKVSYDPNAKCPKWLSFLELVTAGDKDLIRYLQKIAGYTMTGSVEEQVLFFVYGLGGNGKSTYVETLAQVMDEYFVKTGTDTLMTKKSDGGIGNDVARLAGARYVTSMETEGNRWLNEALVKDLTGGDTITARFMYAEHFQFNPTFKLVMYGNHKPMIAGGDQGIWRRVKLVPFEVTIENTPGGMDKKFKENMWVDELPGILNWMLEGCVLWQQESLQDPLVVKEATAEYREDNDTTGEFLRDHFLTGKEAGGAKTPMAAVYTQYIGWAAMTGERVITQRMLGNRLIERGFKKVKANGVWAWVGIKPRA